MVFFCGHPRLEATWNDGIFQHSNWGEAPAIQLLNF